MKGSLFAVGDIHGCHEKLQLLLDALPVDRKKDRLIFLGDYLDRGKSARKVLDILCTMRAAGYRVTALMGNHEYLLLQYHKTGDPSLLPYLRKIGMESTLEGYGEVNLAKLATLSFLPEEHRDFLFSLLPYYETDDYVFVHAGIKPSLPLDKQSLADLCEIREPFLQEPVTLSKTIVFGHTPFASPFVSEKKIGIDTGAVYGNLLTAVQLPELRFFHA